jgi:flagellar hook-associated protein 3 FlgL
MRISTQQFFQRSSQSMGDTQRTLLEAQQRLATGQQRLSSSENPGNAQASLRLTARIEQLDRFARAQDAAEARLNLEDSTLGALTNNLQRVRELALMLGNPTLTESDTLGIQAELRSLKEEAVSLANSAAPTGEALFGGTSADAKAFSVASDGTVNYEGTDSARRLQLGEGRPLTVSTPGDELFQAIPDLNPLRATAGDGNTGTAVFDVPEIADDVAYSAAALPLSVTFNGDGTVDLTDSAAPPVTTTGLAIEDESLTVAGITVAFSGTPEAGDTLTLAAPADRSLFAVYDAVLAAAEAPRSTAAERAAFENQLRDAQDGLEAAEVQVNGARGSVGARLAALNSERSVQEGTRLELEAQRSAIDDLDYTAAITEFQQQLTALQAAQSAFTRLSDLSLFNFLR